MAGCGGAGSGIVEGWVIDGGGFGAEWLIAAEGAGRYDGISG